MRENEFCVLKSVLMSPLMRISQQNFLITRAFSPVLWRMAVERKKVSTKVMPCCQGNVIGGMWEYEPTRNFSRPCEWRARCSVTVEWWVFWRYIFPWFKLLFSSMRTWTAIYNVVGVVRVFSRPQNQFNSVHYFSKKPDSVVEISLSCHMCLLLSMFQLSAVSNVRKIVTKSFEIYKVTKLKDQDQREKMRGKPEFFIA